MYDWMDFIRNIWSSLQSSSSGVKGNVWSLECNLPQWSAVIRLKSFGRPVVPWRHPTSLPRPPHWLSSGKLQLAVFCIIHAVRDYHILLQWDQYLNTPQLGSSTCLFHFVARSLLRGMPWMLYYFFLVTRGVDSHCPLIPPWNSTCLRCNWKLSCKISNASN